MDAVKFITTMSRICHDSSCATCALSPFCSKTCRERTKDDVVKVEKIIEEWLRARPPVTRQSEFLKMYPDATVVHGTIDILPCKLDKTLAEDCDGGHPRECVECKNAYWGKEVE